VAGATPPMHSRSISASAASSASTAKGVGRAPGWTPRASVDLGAGGNLGAGGGGGISVLGGSVTAAATTPPLQRRSIAANNAAAINIAAAATAAVAAAAVTGTPLPLPSVHGGGSERRLGGVVVVDCAHDALYAR
jgi:hypothetical protein